MKTIQSSTTANADGKTDLADFQPVRQRKRITNEQVSNENRKQLIDLITKTNSIRYAAKKLRINESTAKSIYYKFRSTGETDKTDLKTRQTKRKAPTQKNSHGCESTFGEIVDQQMQEQSSEQVTDEKSAVDVHRDEDSQNLNSARNTKVHPVAHTETYNFGETHWLMTNKPK